jgi:WD40 repeat protein
MIRHLLLVGALAFVTGCQSATESTQANDKPAQESTKPPSPPQPKMVADYSVWNLDKTLSWDSHYLNCVAISPDGRTIAVGGGTSNIIESIPNPIETGRVQLWDVSDGAAKLSLTDPGGQIHSVAFYPDGSSLVVGDSNKTKIVDVKTGSVRFMLPEGCRESIAFNVQEKILATNGGSLFWDSVTGQKKPSFIDTDGFAVFSPDGKILYVNGHLWDVRSGRKYASLSGCVSTPAAFSHDGQLVASAFGLWTIRGGEPLWSIAPEMRNVNQLSCTSGAAFSPDDRFLITFNWKGEFEVHESSSGRTVMNATPHLIVNGMALSQDGTVLVTIEEGDDDPIKIWRVGLRQAPPAT